MKTKKKEKTINYLELQPLLIENSNREFLEIFEYADLISKTNKKERFIIHGSKRLYLNSLKKIKKKKKYMEKFLLLEWMNSLKFSKQQTILQEILITI